MMPFEKIRVVEIGSGVALAYCGKLFADLGADVIKVEPPGGDTAMRGMPPLVEVAGGREESAYFAWLNTNKQGVTADPEDNGDSARLRALIRAADILLDSRAPRTLTGSPLAHKALREVDPDLVICAISWFGETGPYRDFVATEAVCRALAGGIHAIGPVEGPPVIPLDGQNGVIAGLASFIAAAAALYGRDKGGRRFSVSIHEALMHAVEMDFSAALSNGRSRNRPGINLFGRHHPSSIYQTSDGWIGISTVTPAQWRGFCAMMGRPDIGDDPRYRAAEARMQAGHTLDQLFVPMLQDRPSMHWFEAGLRHRLALVIVPSMAQLVEQSVHRGRNAFVPVRIGGATFEAPVLPQRLGDAGPLAGGTAPLAGEHDAKAMLGTAPHGAACDGRTGTSCGLPLAGLRIVDLTMGWAGPLATRLLGDLGAEIIKVESCIYPDWWRGADRSAAFFEQRLYERNNNFNMMNRNKLGVTLDLTRPEGVAALQQLIAGAHGLMENYAADVLPKLGLTYEVLSRTRRDLIMVSMSAFGADNAWSTCRAYGGTLEQGSGLPTVTGDPSWPPTMSAYAYGDPVSGFNAAAAMLAGLMLQQRGAGGRRINMSQIEGMLSLVAPKMIEQAVAGRVAPRLGNRHPSFVPHGCFRCAGADEWLVVVVADVQQWRALCAVIGRDDLAADPGLLTADGRRIREDEIECAITAWAGGVPGRSAMQRLQDCGVPAGIAATATELLHNDPHLAARGFWQVCDRPFVGSCVMLSAPFRETAAPYAITRASPTLGQDNAEIFGRYLGWTEMQLDELARQRIIGTEAFAVGPGQTATNAAERSSKRANAIGFASSAPQ